MLRRLIIIAVILGLLVGAGGYWLLWASAGPEEGPHTIIVEEGSSVAKVADQLVAAGAVPGTATTYRAMARIFGSGDPVQAGEFEIPRGMGGAAVLDLLQHGRPVQRLLNIAEGTPSIIVQEKLAALPLLTGAAPLPPEGSVLPDSYGYQRGETRAAVLKRMTDAMDKELAALWAKRKPTTVVKTPEEAIILASIVEKETGKASERRMVAGVLSNRIRIGMALGADATTIYPVTKGKPLGRMIRKSELAADNGYNPRRMAGLPVGPITNPGRDSIAAVLDPAATDALY